MTAFLTADSLRGRAAPVFSHPMHREIAAAACRSAASQRVVLRAQCRKAPDGRLICRWRMDLPAPLQPPPR
jgi:hypothetical protein